MAMTRQMVLLITSLLLLACGGGWLVQQWSLHASLQQQLQTRNAEAAQLLGQALSQLRGDEAAMRALVLAQFEQGAYERVSLRSSDGKLWVERQAKVLGEPAAPAWFAELARLDATAGQSVVGNEGRPIATLSVQSRRYWAVHALWQSALRTAALLAVLATLGLAVCLWRLRIWQKGLDQIAEQAQALQEGRFQYTREPREQDLRPVVKSMNALVSRLADQFAAQSAQVHTLQRLAHADAVTGLARRESFLRRVGAFSEIPECLGLTLVMLRLRNLNALNESVGHESVDSFLGAVGEMLDDYPRRVNGALAGRLNGTDMAVFLPARGVARDTAHALASTLSALAERSLPGLVFAVGATESTGAMPLADLLAACDTALAQAEWRGQGRAHGASLGEVVVRLVGDSEDEGNSDSLPASDGPGAGGSASGVDAPRKASRGSRGWRTRITAALDAGRVGVAEFPVLDRHGKLLHLECPLRVQPEVDGAVLPAREWLPWASRSALLPRLELAGLVHVLKACAADGRRRALHLCESSIVQSGAVQALTAVLDDHRDAAPLVCIEIAESTWAHAAAPLAALGRALRERQVCMGLEHAGLALPSRSFVQGIALSYVKIDARYVRQANSDLTARDLASALVQQARSLGALAIAEGVGDEAEQQGLFALGFDGVTGPGVQLEA